ncbi:porin family protein [Winogradskyella vincentii]|uniref:PorT family protein n=1 Tax=Winogradskyella vincentii TaxID=2877122 RepID=A0ABS7Y3D1_9FLAO|nr:porin family protein [Winogradskyella vincentii]MCA0154428.1 PorT family protein [Winogradskyella vincentii]
MKSLFITIAITIVTFYNVYGQQDDTKTTNFGIKGGYNLSAVSFDGDGETGQRHAFHLGLYNEAFISDALALQIELLYSQQGYEIEDGSGTFTQKLDYINLPLMLKMYPSGHFFLEVGPQAGLAISHKEEFDSSFNLFDTSQEFEPSNFDWGINFGGGFKTDSGVSLGVRYHLGFGDIYDAGSPQNRVWQFSIGFDF